jgi:hypothetical protein
MSHDRAGARTTTDSSDGMRLRFVEPLLVALSSFALACGMTYPLVVRLGSTGRVDSADGSLSIWNVAWVARTLVVDPWHLFDANIFFPNRATLAYSENNIGAGILALVPYWSSGRNAYVAHNVVVLLAFSLTATGMYFLVRHLTGDRRSAAVSAILFAFCPHVFGHTAHIQLLMTAGLPFTMLAFHRVVEGPTIGRGAQLGLAMAAQAWSCGYYAVFLLLMVGYGVLVVVFSRGREMAATWKALGFGALISVALVALVFRPYFKLQQATGFARGLNDAVRYSADWRAYLASSSYAHAWMLKYLRHWNEVLFPGFLAMALGIVGSWVTFRRRRLEILALYAGLAILACWASFGPAAGLYSALYRALPLFAWLHAPSRFGLVVAFALAVLSGVGLSAILPRGVKGTVIGVAVAGLAAAELAVPFPIVEVPKLLPVYRLLGTLPRAPVIEMPFYYPEVGLFRHTVYMLNSTSHWFPLVNGYSDYIPPDFRRNVMTLAPFPSRDAFKILESLDVRYAVFHWYGYNAENRRDVLGRLEEFKDYLRPLYGDEGTQLYELVGFPP